ncbi:MAG TPA: DUF302 domain-containing protein [Acidisarcina sp.]
MTEARDAGLTHLRSSHTVAETLSLLEAIVRRRGLTIVARIDHGSAAASVGLKMPPTELLIFGNPISGTPLMLASPTAAIDLPLKALAWQDADGDVWLSYNNVAYLQKRHNLPEELVKNIAGIRSICEEAAG